MIYRLIQMVDDQMVKTEFTEENILPAMEMRGFVLRGINRNPKQREELQGTPVFVGVCGPMWDGDAVRYEDNASYERLSA